MAELLNLRTLIREKENEMREATRRIQEAKKVLPGLYAALHSLGGNNDESEFIESHASGSGRQDRILRLLAQTSQQLRPVEIARALNDDPTAIRTMLHYAKQKGLVVEENGYYQIPRIEAEPQKVEERELECA